MKRLIGRFKIDDDVRVKAFFACYMGFVVHFWFFFFFPFLNLGLN